jgi:hypothetical protein
LIVKGELDLHAKLIDVEVNDFRQVVGEKINMCQLADHMELLVTISTGSLSPG